MMGTMVHAIAPGRLLVATPVIGDPNFERTVVVVLDAGLSYAVNRTTELMLISGDSPLLNAQ